MIAFVRKTPSEISFQGYGITLHTTEQFTTFLTLLNHQVTKRYVFYHDSEKRILFFTKLLHLVFPKGYLYNSFHRSNFVPRSQLYWSKATHSLWLSRTWIHQYQSSSIQSQIFGLWKCWVSMQSRIHGNRVKAASQKVWSSTRPNPENI